MKTTTKLAAGTLAALAGFALLTTANWQEFAWINRSPMTSKVRPTGSDSVWVKLRGTWSDEGPAFITITAGNNVDPPSCHSAPCGENPYLERVEVQRGHEVVFSVQSVSYKGRATCLILAPGEDFGAKVPPGARMESTTGGHVTCKRSVTW